MEGKIRRQKTMNMLASPEIKVNWCPDNSHWNANDVYIQHVLEKHSYWEVSIHFVWSQISPNQSNDGLWKTSDQHHLDHTFHSDGIRGADEMWATDEIQAGGSWLNRDRSSDSRLIKCNRHIRGSWLIIVGGNSACIILIFCFLF